MTEETDTLVLGGRDRGMRTPRSDWRRWIPSKRVLFAAALVAVVAIFTLREHSAQHDFVGAFTHVRLSRAPWIAVALIAEGVSFVCYGMAQRELLIAGGSRLPRRSLIGLTFAATGITSLVPGGVVPASGWLIRQYQRRGVETPLAVWAVLAGGFAATVSVLALLLIGAGIAGVGNPVLLAVSGLVLVVGSAGFVVAVQHLEALERAFERHHLRRSLHLVHRAAVLAAQVAGFRSTYRRGFAVFVFSILNWLLDTCCLLACFAFLSLPIPWRSALFAYAVSQVAASLIPLPAGIGVVAGGMVGAFALAGVPAGDALVATVVYRVLSYWLVAALGTPAVIWISRREPQRTNVVSTAIEVPATGTATIRPIQRYPARAPLRAAGSAGDSSEASPEYPDQREAG